MKRVLGPKCPCTILGATAQSGSDGASPSRIHATPFGAQTDCKPLASKESFHHCDKEIVAVCFVALTADVCYAGTRILRHGIYPQDALDEYSRSGGIDARVRFELPAKVCDIP
jgi:hypothetical protein